jgi:hypothetical protein
LISAARSALGRAARSCSASGRYATVYISRLLL